MHKTPLLLPLSYHPINMRPLLFLSSAFINTFGITQPTPKTATRTAWFIATMLALVVVLVASAAALVLHLAFHR
ncbi:MAG: hypothetical protein ABI380_06025 [Edaphobacter sp.]